MMSESLPSTKRSVRAAVAQDGPLVAVANGLRALGRALRRPFSNTLVVSALLAAVLAVAGFGAFYLGWRGAAATLVPAIQMAFLVSGGLAGFALLGTGLGLVTIQVARKLAARERYELDELVDRAQNLLEAVSQLGPTPPAGDHITSESRSEVPTQ